MNFSTIIYRSDLVIPGTKSALYVEEIFEFSDILYGTVYGAAIFFLVSIQSANVTHYLI